MHTKIFSSLIKREEEEEEKNIYGTASVLIYSVGRHFYAKQLTNDPECNPGINEQFRILHRDTTNNKSPGI